MSRDRDDRTGRSDSTAPPVQRSPGTRTLTQRLASKMAATPTVAAAHRETAATAAPSLGPAVLDDPFAFHLPVQAKAPRPLDAGAVQDHAARGVDGPGQALPHQAAIQAAFGHHDVSGVRAHLGGAAGEAATAIGAEAYATGNDVAFARAPDLHTAAHEATHVVQQRGGVQLYGGVGEVGDRYERHADQVADGVVAGRSVEALLDTMATGTAASPAIQRSPAKTTSAGSDEVDLVGAVTTPQATTDAYAARHWDALRTAARSALLAADLAWAPPLRWDHSDPAARVEVALASLWPVVFVRETWDPAFARDLDGAIELGLSIGTARQAQVAADDDRGARYHPAVGNAVGNTLARRLQRSMRTIGSDYLAAYEAAGGGAVDTARIPVESASDRAAAALLAFVQVMGPINRPRPQPRAVGSRRGRRPALPVATGTPVEHGAGDATDEAVVERVHDQLLQLAGLLGESNLDALAPAYAFVADGPGATPDDWNAAVVGQAERLELIRGELLALVALSYRDVPLALKADALAAYAKAAGGAHGPSAARLLQAARAEVADLDRRAAMSEAQAEARATEARDPARLDGADLDAIEARADRATRGSGSVATTASAHETTVGAPATVTDPAPSPRDDAHASRVETFRQGALRVGDALADARQALARARELVGGMFTAAVAQDCEGLGAEIAVLEGFLHHLTDDTLARATGGVALVEDVVIAEAESRFREFVTSSGILNLGHRVQATLDRVESAVRIVQTVGFLVVMLGAAVAGGLAGAYVGGLVRGALTAGTQATTGAVVAGATAAVATESFVVGGVQTAVTGDSFATAAGENMLAAGLTFGALSGVRGLRILAGARSAWASGATIRFLGAGALDVAIGLGANHAATSLLRPDVQASDDLFLESTTTATSISLGRLIGARLRGLHARLDALGAHHGHDLRLNAELSTLRRELLLLEAKVPTDPTPPDQLDALVDGHVTPLAKRVTELEQQANGASEPTQAASVEPTTSAGPTTTGSAAATAPDLLPAPDRARPAARGALSPHELLAERPPLEKTFEHALQPQLYIDDVVAHYGLNLRDVKAVFDPSLESGKLGVTRASEGGMVIRIGRDAFVDQATLANTIAHELSHARDYQRGSHKPHGDASSDDDGTVYGAGNALERWIRTDTGDNE